MHPYHPLEVPYHLVVVPSWSAYHLLVDLVPLEDPIGPEAYHLEVVHLWTCHHRIMDLVHLLVPYHPEEVPSPSGGWSCHLPEVVGTHITLWWWSHWIPGPGPAISPSGGGPIGSPGTHITFWWWSHWSLVLVPISPGGGPIGPSGPEEVCHITGRWSHWISRRRSHITFWRWSHWSSVSPAMSLEEVPYHPLVVVPYHPLVVVPYHPLVVVPFTISPGGPITKLRQHFTCCIKSIHVDLIPFSIA